MIVLNYSTIIPQGHLATLHRRSSLDAFNIGNFFNYLLETLLDLFDFSVDLLPPLFVARPSIVVVVALAVAVGFVIVARWRQTMAAICANG